MHMLQLDNLESGAIKLNRSLFTGIQFCSTILYVVLAHTDYITITITLTVNAEMFSFS